MNRTLQNFVTKALSAVTSLSLGLTLAANFPAGAQSPVEHPILRSNTLDALT